MLMPPPPAPPRQLSGGSPLGALCGRGDLDPSHPKARAFLRGLCLAVHVITAAGGAAASGSTAPAPPSQHALPHHRFLPLPPARRPMAATIPKPPPGPWPCASRPKPLWAPPPPAARRPLPGARRPPGWGRGWNTWGSQMRLTTVSRGWRPTRPCPGSQRSFERAAAPSPRPVPPPGAQFCHSCTANSATLVTPALLQPHPAQHSPLHRAATLAGSPLDALTLLVACRSMPVTCQT